ncbi:uncharacterized protein Z518_10566 [Rhinocladiella mackenziei CBS 650.93]|uniref:Mitochondrial outer membrane transport complex Sam37/metaxin N-terminal domain-containing protein n=1 Tax=Rhinocladiella mackenziei CBS 650.93 TaxID=1442369 RepID=A0A0D2FEE4_9EURO|nr:uncharacterized protein Z518_10566 [Rhinocladiella mackenziei CBS 650.93]KIX00427.1 hypothetical protein Z518_10566 [Rhinocladiella mackenziei CBS 650.93]
MVLELHTWGPAFDLPSIDPQCLATIFYLQKCLPIDAWSLIPSSDPTINSFRELPALRDGHVWVSGFGGIVTYLRDISHGDWDLDKALDEHQRADCAASTSFLESRGHPLLDLSLYVSSDNYLHSTRQALGHILTWPNNWILPHQLRAKAKKRSEHLGMSSLDVDTAQEDEGEDARLTAHIPKSLRKPRQTVSSLLGRSTQKNRFRLDAVTADFFDPLMEILGNKVWLIGEQECSADCLAIGYLALMQIPQLPHDWLKKALQTKYSRLGQWSQRQITLSFGSPVDMAVVQGRRAGLASANAILPWQTPGERRAPQILRSVLEAVVSSIPVIGSGYVISEIGNEQAGGPDRYRQKQLTLNHLQRRRDIYVQIWTSACVVTGLLGWMLYKGMLQLPHRAPAPKRRSFGEAGAFLGLV